MGHDIELTGCQKWPSSEYELKMNEISLKLNNKYKNCFKF